MLLHNLSSKICRFRRIRVFHRLFHISAGFPQRLSFPLAFFERDRVRYADSVGSSCSVRHGMVRYCTVRLGTVPRDVASASRVTNPPERPPSAPCRAADDRRRKPLRRLCFLLLNLHYVNRFRPSVSNSGKWAISIRQNGAKNFLSAFFARILRFSLQISARKGSPFRTALCHFEPCFSARVTPG